MVSKKELKKMLQRYTGFVEKISVMAYAVDLKIQFEIREAEIAVEKAIEAGEEEAKLNVIKAHTAECVETLNAVKQVNREAAQEALTNGYKEIVKQITE